MHISQRNWDILFVVKYSHQFLDSGSFDKCAMRKYTFYDHILLSRVVTSPAIACFVSQRVPFLHNSSVGYNNINAKRNINISIILLKYQCTYISAHQKDNLLCPVLLVLLKTMNESGISSYEGCIKMMAGT